MNVYGPKLVNCVLRGHGYFGGVFKLNSFCSKTIFLSFPKKLQDSFYFIIKNFTNLRKTVTTLPGLVSVELDFGEKRVCYNKHLLLAFYN